MPILYNDILRPGFLIRSNILAAGETRVHGTIPESATFLADEPTTFEATWASLERLVLALTLAGYEVPELVIAAPRFDNPGADRGYLRFTCHIASQSYASEEWRTRLGMTVGAHVYLVLALRVEVRRTFGQPSLHPPVSLAGVPGYLRAPDTTQALSDPQDGWLVLEAATVPGRLDVVAQTLEASARAAVVDALVTAWTDEASGNAVGLLRCFDPTFWESPLDRSATVKPFDVLASEIWAWHRTPSRLRAFLEAATDAPQATLGQLAADAGASTSIADAVDALDARRALFHPREANLPNILARLKKRHWALGLFQLHEYGVVRILPFPVAYSPSIPLLDLTGWYETDKQYEASGRPVIATMQINQAGERLDGWWYDDQLRRWEFGGTLDVTTYDPENPDTGTAPLSFLGLGSREGVSKRIDLTGVPRKESDTLSFTVKVGSEKYKMVRRDRLARLPTTALLAAMPIGAPSDTDAQLARLHRLTKQTFVKALKLLIVEIEGIRGLGLAYWDSKTLALGYMLKNLLEDDRVLRFVGDVPDNTPMLARLRADLGRGLLRYPVVAAGGADGWTTLMSIVTATGGDSKQIQLILGVPPSAKHDYTFQFTGLGFKAKAADVLGAEAGSFRIAGPIEHLSSCAARPEDAGTHGWKDWYVGRNLTGGIELGPEVRLGAAFITASDPNGLSTDFEWSADDFLCVFLTGAAGGFFGAFEGVGFETGGEFEVYTFLSPNGDIAVGSGPGMFIEAGVGFGGGAGIGAGLTVSWLSSRTGNATVAAATIPPSVQLSLVANTDAVANYAINSSTLSDKEIAFLAGVVARYRALFEAPGSFLLIEGDASPTGTDEYNLALSWSRALAAYGALRSLLSAPPAVDWGESNALAPRDGRVRIVGYGETRARGYVANGIESADWRRTKIVVNDTLLVIL